MNISKLFIYELTLDNQGKDLDTATRNIFNAICQNKNVDITYTDQIKNQTQGLVVNMRQRIKKAHRVSNSKHAFIASIQNETRCFKVHVGEFVNTSLIAEVLSTAAGETKIRRNMPKA